MCVKMTPKTLFDQTILVFQKLDANMNPDLALKMPKVYIIIGSLRFHIKLNVRVAF